VLALAGLPACCGAEAPVWTALAPVELAPTERASLDLAGFVRDDHEGI
jgi:hypothetical protein